MNKRSESHQSCRCKEQNGALERGTRLKSPCKDTHGRIGNDQNEIQDTGKECIAVSEDSLTQIRRKALKKAANTPGSHKSNGACEKTTTQVHGQGDLGYKDAAQRFASKAHGFGGSKRQSGTNNEKHNSAVKKFGGVKTPLSSTKPVIKVPSDKPILGPAAVRAVPSQGHLSGAESTTQDIAALDAKPQEKPCRKRPM